MTVMIDLIIKVLRLFKRCVRYSLAPLIRLLEPALVKSRKAFKPPVFIVGAPRTGSTILYQALTNLYSIAYIDNTACAWCKNLRFGMWLSHKKYGDEPHENYVAEHGSTQLFGGHAPSECGDFWYRWLPKDRHFIDYSDITQKMVRQLQAEVTGVSSLLNKPLLFKNLNAGQRLRLISRAFPNAKIIFICRDPRFVVKSIMNARAKSDIKEGEWWSIMPKNVSDLKKLPELQMCAAQVYYLEKQIEQDLTLFPSENVMRVHYQELKGETIHRLGRWIGVKRRANAKMPEFHNDSISNLSSDEYELLNSITQKYKFSQDVFI